MLSQDLFLYLSHMLTVQSAKCLRDDNAWLVCQDFARQLLTRQYVQLFCASMACRLRILRERKCQGQCEPMERLGARLRLEADLKLRERKVINVTRRAREMKEGWVYVDFVRTSKGSCLS